MNVDRFFGVSGNGFENRHSEGYVWDKKTVHDINVEPVCFTIIDHFDVALQVCKIGGEDGGCNQSIFHVVFVWFIAAKIMIRTFKMDCCNLNKVKEVLETRVRDEGK